MTDPAPATEWNEAEFQSVLERLGAEGTLDARRVRISPQRLQRILEAAPRDPDLDDRPMLRGADFRGATFTGGASFGGATFTGDARFHETTFAGDADFDGATFTGDASFGGATFRRRVWLGPVVVAGTLSFGRTAFDEEVRLDAAAAQLFCRGTRFGGRADLNVRWAEVALDEATCVQRSRLAGEPFRDIDDGPAQVCRLDDRRLDAQPRPRVLSVRQANVENLALGNIDLRACRFFGAHGLDQLRIEADCDFAEPPPRRRYTRRRTLAEEHHWHARPSLEGSPE